MAEGTGRRPVSKRPTFNDTPVTYRLELLEASSERLVAVAREWGVPVKTIQRYLRHLRQTYYDLMDAGLINAPQSVIEHRSASFESEWERWCALLGRDPARPVPRAGREEGKQRRVVAIADTHGDPYMPGLVKMLDDETPDVVVVAGDVLDCFSFSRWPKGRDEPVRDEMARVRVMLEVLAARVGRVVLLKGNHDKRALRYFMRHIDERFLDLVQAGLLEAVARGLDNVDVVCEVLDYHTPGGDVMPAQLTQEFFVEVGDAVIGHPEIAHKHPGSAVREFAARYNNWAAALGKPIPRLVATGHDHKWSVSQGALGQVWASLGYFGMVSRLDYLMDRALSPYAPAPGYLAIDQDRVEAAGKPSWKTRLSSVRYVVL